jgi:hypothetical protein
MILYPRPSVHSYASEISENLTGTVGDSISLVKFYVIKTFKFQVVVLANVFRQPESESTASNQKVQKSWISHSEYIARRLVPRSIAKLR